MTLRPTVHCWECGDFHGMPGHTCLQPADHAGDHVWTRNDYIVEYFRKDT